MAEHNQQNGAMVALCIAGNTPEEIALELSSLKNEELAKLLIIYQCSIGDLTKKICQAKGIKFGDKKNERKQIKQKTLFRSII